MYESFLYVSWMLVQIVTKLLYVCMYAWRVILVLLCSVRVTEIKGVYGDTCVYQCLCVCMCVCVFVLVYV